MTIKIQQGIPVPPAKTGRRAAVFPFRDMKVGDSFFYAQAADETRRRLRNGIDAYTRRNRALGGKVTFMTQAVDGGWRCWRIK